MSLLEQDTTRKKQVNNTLLEPEKDLKFEARDKKEYEIKAIIDTVMYSQQANGKDQMSGLYYLILWKNYLEEENTWELSSVVIHLRKLISTFHKEYSEKLTVTSPSMARLTVSKKK